jgi:uncharacterized protein YwqG
MHHRKTILQCLKTAGHADLTKDLEPLIRPAIFLTGHKLSDPPVDFYGKKGKENAGVKKFDAMMKTLALGDSRFGGLPDLPPNIEWPTRKRIPMEFVAQIRLADIAAHDPENDLPHTGSLLFFYNSQWDSYDMSNDYNSCRVLFHDGPDSLLVRTPAPTKPWKGEYDEKPRPAPYVHGLARLTFSRFEMPPAGVSPFIDPKTKLGDVWQDFHCEYSSTWSPAPRGGTYVENHLLGYVEGQDYVDAHENGKRDRCLLQVDSDDSAGFQWGDCDRLYFLLTDEQLKARDFSKVRIYSLLG